MAVSYSMLNQQLGAYFARHPHLDIDKWKFDVTHVEASDANGRVLLTVTVRGKLNGTFYLWGTPRVRAGGTILEFPDVQFAAESKSAIDKIKIGLAELLVADLRGKIEEATTVDLDPEIRKARTALAKAYTVGSVTLTLNLVLQLSPGTEPIYSRPDMIVVNVEFKGTASGSIAS